MVTAEAIKIQHESNRPRKNNFAAEFAANKYCVNQKVIASKKTLKMQRKKH